MTSAGTFEPVQTLVSGRRGDDRGHVPRGGRRIVRGVVDAAPEIGGELRVGLREAVPLTALTAAIAVASRSARPGLAGIVISACMASGLPGGRPGRPVEDMIETRLAVRSG